MQKQIIKMSVMQALLLVATLAPSAQAAISLDRTRVIFDGNQKSVSLNINNQNEQFPYLAQSWIEDDKGNKVQGPLTVLPPIQRLEPGKSSQVKIQGLPIINTLPQDRETLFYFNLREIPPKSNKPNSLQIALQTRVKLFYRPGAIAIDSNKAAPQEKITLRRQGDRYVVDNPTAYYVTIVDGKPNGGVSARGFTPLMVAPKSHGELSVSASALGSKPELIYVNDYGGRPSLLFNCDDNQCRLMPSEKK
ncbi:fimbria/pilus periplasmic chaperone [Enterobacter roggenkampii]|uniref:fimbria/pilus periplasmic chaperone n=1 Tax=Enterobacter roggenkampii TaxID=1812935 RepID=UPI000DA16255|nr:fimbria/pilus periplasmic chaperone [Enterobacter roggenkampii]